MTDPSEHDDTEMTPEESDSVISGATPTVVWNQGGVIGTGSAATTVHKSVRLVDDGRAPCCGG